MLRILQLKLPVVHTKTELETAIRKELRLPPDAALCYQIKKRSIDARKKQDIHYVYVIDAELSEQAEKRILSKVKTGISLAPREEYSFVPYGTKKMKYRPVIIGAGPAGLFCAYFLAKHGYRPLIIERGEEIEKRQQTVELFWKTGCLNTESNVQFGEGGAGTFSDGKLNTMVKDPSGRIRKVLELFTEHGAPEEILYLNKPHIGTDRLRSVISDMRRQMEEWGAEFRFSTKATDLFFDAEHRLCALEFNHTERTDCEIAVAAIGHSARDTFEMLSRKPLVMESKAFAIGVRIEHPQDMINRSQYGTFADRLPAADYKLTHQTKNGRGVYSFCMCPGGFVVNASSEEQGLAVNGMSNHDRAERNANSALIVTVTPEDFAGEQMDGVLAGVYFQKKWEELAYRQCRGSIPVQLLGDFFSGQTSTDFGQVLPDIKGSYSFADLRHCLPEYVTESLKEGILAFDSKIQGFARHDAVLSGVETRTSSPIRILRSETLESSVAGFYPCGEGAGYAGGIMSAAVDGIKVFEAIASVYQP